MKEIKARTIERNLSGLQKNIYHYFKCLTDVHFDKTTGPIRFQVISEHINAPISSIKKSIQRLIKKGIIKREMTKLGPGGWCEYSLCIPSSSYNFKENEYIDQTIKKVEQERNILFNKLKERNKELNCLYQFSKITEDQLLSIPDVYQKLANLIPSGMQYPENSCCRIIANNESYTTSNFKITKCKISKYISSNYSENIKIEIFYLNYGPEYSNVTFLKEESILLNDISQRLIEFIERKKHLQEKKLERKKLEEANITLKNILWSLDDEKRKFKENISLNIEKNILPIIYDLENFSHTNLAKLSSLKTNLLNLTDEFHRKIINLKYNLTSSEIEICRLIKSGLLGKNIAEKLNISEDTVKTHRKNIRKKFNLTNSEIHLKNFLDQYC